MEMTVENLTNKTENHIDTFARVGYLARATVYGFMGVLAVMMFTGNGGTATDSKGAIRTLLEQPFGRPALLVLAMGLLAYAVFRFFQSIRDYDHHGKDMKGILHRVAYFIGGAIHVFLGYYALNLIFHFGKTTGKGEQGIAQTILAQPFGRSLLFALAAIVIGFGVSQIYIAVKEKFTRGLSLPPQNRKLLCNISKFGLSARGVMFMTVGWLFAKAALHANSAEAKGVKGAWTFLGTQPFGTTLELLIAGGLIAFAFYGVIEAMYRHINASPNYLR
jgi:hypothetical protein